MHSDTDRRPIRLACRIGNGLLLAVGLAVTTAGMCWLSHLDADSANLTIVPLPTVR